MDPAELERLAHRALRQLPAPRAPRTLLPRVVAAAARLVPRPWYTRAWLTWPRGWQVASAAAVVAVAIGAAFVAPAADRALDAMAGASGTASTWIVAALDGASLVAGIVSVIWRSLLLPLGVIVFAVVLAMSLAGGVCVNIITRVALGAEGATPS